MIDENSQEKQHKKHLLILGAGASMSLVPEKNVLKKTLNDNKEKIDENEELRLPSGSGLVDYIASYVTRIKSYVVVKKIIPEELRYDVSHIGVNEYMNEFEDIHNHVGSPFEYDPNIRKYITSETSDLERFCIDGIQKLYADDSMAILGINSLEYYITENNDNEHLKYLFIAGYLVKKYNPMSMDYFANNLYFFARNEIELLISEKIFEDKENAVEVIQKYLKLIIFEILSQKQKSTIDYALNNVDNNYIRQIIWNMTLEANRIDKKLDPKKYIEDNLDIITFNYDITTEYLLNHYNAIEYQSFAEIKSDTKMDNNKVNVIHVYSHLYAGVGKMIHESINKIDNTFNIIDLIFTNPDKINELLEKCDDYINWIRANHDENSECLTNKCIELFDNADNIYFLGFGFDKNNLKQIGFLDYYKNKRSVELNMKQSYNKNLYVSQGNGKIMDILEQVYTYYVPDALINRSLPHRNIISRFGSNQVYHYYLFNRKYGIQISTNKINDAFEKDFVI